ncbi:Oidioi.mRNA.OKI2018_I69.PAR.g10065.t1.cds [Oikopleura dioica]|uniref:Oidioi.mRNA.OKI2018_I69.PAR.g10065.t1.cds n=1 Tax=Oikopleura dioica TaxID=34765 RepID=A0ABN7RU09_OIKDI|nr:Oidioi.mRNA.OKI2018_I69.PAR.g10065.t1.cds [Oikopleura dioica]
MRLFGYFGCPYCAKVRAYLKFRGIDNKDVEVSIGKPELKGVIENYLQVPVLAFYNNSSSEPDAVVKDSGAIVSTLEQVLRGVAEPMSDIAK